MTVWEIGTARKITRQIMHPATTVNTVHNLLAVCTFVTTEMLQTGKYNISIMLDIKLCQLFKWYVDVTAAKVWTLAI